MKVEVFPSIMEGAIVAPPSKSMMQRACAASLLRKGETHIFKAGNSNDEKAALQVIQQLGAQVHFEEDVIVVKSTGLNPGRNTINCGESGLGIRMFTPIVALSAKEITIHGEGSLKERPLDFFDQIFPHLGIAINSNSGKVPLKVKGPLNPVDIRVDGSLSSQFLTGLIFAYSFLSTNMEQEEVAIVVNDLKSRPYIDMTLDILKHFGLPTPEYNTRTYDRFLFKRGSNNVQEDKEVLTYNVEGDWSNAAFLLVAGAISGSLNIIGLDLGSFQADKGIMDALSRSGANLKSNGTLSITSGPLIAFDFDATHCPDLFPPLCVLAAYCEGISTIKGVSRLAHKESNRALTLQEELGKMGIEINIDGDEMRIMGGGDIKGAVVQSRNDHRIAMAAAIAGIGAKESTIIEHAEAVNKSYPGFFNDVQSIGMKMQVH